PLAQPKRMIRPALSSEPAQLRLCVPGKRRVPHSTKGSERSPTLRRANLNVPRRTRSSGRWPGQTTECKLMGSEIVRAAGATEKLAAPREEHWGRIGEDAFQLLIDWV